MNHSTSQNRDQLLFFLSELSGPKSLTAPERHLAISALNLATEEGTDALLSASRRLAIGALFLEGSTEELPPQTLVIRLADHRLFPLLPPELIEARLQHHRQQLVPHPLRRAPQALHDRSSSWVHHALLELNALNLRFEEFFATDQPRRFDLLLADSLLLFGAIETLHHAPDSELASTLRPFLPPTPLPSSSASLTAFARFESLRYESLPAPFSRLKDRDHRFESSLASHLQNYDLLSLLRLLLASGPASMDVHADDTRLLRRYLPNFALFADDPSLVEFFVALHTMRHRCLAHIQGDLPMDALSPWVDYLRGPCLDFAEIHDLSLREAINLAHYTLHLLNLFDLASFPDLPVTGLLRRSLLDLEEELKEFALVAQEQGMLDARANLKRFEDARWRRRGARAHLADRLARLAGAWQYGLKAGPPGQAPRLQGETFDTIAALLGLDEADQADNHPRFDVLANLIRTARFQRTTDLPELPPLTLIGLIEIALRAAHKEPAIRTDKPYLVDFSPLHAWLHGDAYQRRIELLTTLVSTFEHRLAKHPDALPAGFLFSAANQRLDVQICPDERIEALLTLLADPLTPAPVRAHLKEMIATQSPSPLTPAGPQSEIETIITTDGTDRFPESI